MPNSISRQLGAQIVREKEAHDLSRNPEFASFQFLAYHTSATAVELVALCDADGLVEGDVVRLRDEFFGLVRWLPHEFGLKPRGRNPNGLLGFVFAGECPESMARFIARQTQISHAAESGGVSVAWAVDVPNRRIHTHDNPVSIFPPVIVNPRTVYPGLEYLQSLLDGTAAPPPPPPPPPIRQTGDGVGSGITRILFVGADSLEEPLDLGWELKGIETNLRLAKERDRLDVEPLMGATMDGLTQAMLDLSPTIVHFSGHGEAAGLVLRNEGGAKHVVSGEALASLFELFSENVRCVILNACSSEEHARAIHRHVPHVIGVRAPIPDSTAIAFSSGFYKALGAGRDVPFAYKLGIARARAEGGDWADLIVLL